MLRWLLLVCLLLVFPLQQVLPATWGWENGPLEWLQVVVLSLGLLLASRWAWQSHQAHNITIARFWISRIPLWAILIGRELSWGRVFYPTGISANGPAFLSLKQIWYGPAVYPLLVVIFGCWVFYIMKYKLYTVLRSIVHDRNLPLIETGFTLVSAIIAAVSEKWLHNQVLEELIETVIYLGLVCMSIQINHTLRCCYAPAKASEVPVSSAQ